MQAIIFCQCKDLSFLTYHKQIIFSCAAFVEREREKEKTELSKYLYTWLADVCRQEEIHTIEDLLVWINPRQEIK